MTPIDLGWGLLSQFLPFRYFPNFSALSKQTLAIEYHVYIWQVSPQLSCGDTCQIYMWFEKFNMYFCHIENFAYGEINERNFRNPHSWSGMRNTYTTMVIISRWRHMNVMKSQITGHPTVCLTAYADPHERYIKVRITGPLRWIHRWPVNSPHKGPVTHKKLPFV